jgi:hypothetical protein
MALLDLCYNSYGSDPNSKAIGESLMIDFKRLRAHGPLDQHQLKNNVSIDLEKMQDFIKGIWYTNFINIFADRTRYRPIPNSQLNSFYASVSVLASNLVTLKFLIYTSFFQQFFDFTKIIPKAKRPFNTLNIRMVRFVEAGKPS